MDVLLPFFAQYYNEWSVLHMSENGNQSREWNSRFGYIMVAAGAAIDGLKYYLLPDFSKFNFTVFSQAATQVLFSVGIGNIIVPPRFGLLSNIKLPWLDASGISHLGI